MEPENEEFIPEEAASLFTDALGNSIWTPPAPQLYAGEIIALQEAGLISVGEARDLLNSTYGIELD